MVDPVARRGWVLAHPEWPDLLAAWERVVEAFQVPA